MKPTLFEVVIKAENQGEGEDLSQKANLQKMMNAPFVTKKGIGRKTVRSCIKRKEKGVSEACMGEDDKSVFSLACVSSVTSTEPYDSVCSFHMCFQKGVVLQLYRT